MNRCLLLLALFAALPAYAADHAVAFMYHRFDEARYPSTNVPIAAFATQLERLDQGGFTVWPLERVVGRLVGGEPLPDKTVAITVDDAYRSVAEHAWPRLKARGWPLTVFVSTDAIDRGLPDFMDWPTIRRLAGEGVRFANHGAAHDHLVQRRQGEDEATWRARVRADIERGARRLREELGEAAAGEPPLFAYPYGEYNTALADLVAGLGYVAFGQHSGAMGRHSDRRALPRYPVAEDYADPDEFVLKAASLPLPVERVEPWEPVVGADNPPRLVVTLAEGTAGVDRLACYGSGQGRLAVEWLEPGRRFAVRAAEPFVPGRARYNCTAPAGDGRWQWFSQPWLIPPVAADRAG